MDLVFKALAHPERRRILASLHQRPGRSLFEICASSVAENGEPLSRQTISQHLDVLERAGLLEITWKGRTKTHAINLDPLRAAVEAAINRYL
ncbi:ArsR family transcriptional regulator [Ciceribacter ferrooxidans]|uniref:ArsR family transcriptional regulator n=1 Tax=Ciceribacter ferrooxidans TaxID=2509717 RepID=A0A4Q2U1U6_9HYPH|nr:ArsR family transcriptional regulator [Ciceribacter ferrooxidans]